MTDFPHGPCECRIGCECQAKPGPAAFTVTRDGKTLKVCTRCDFRADRPLRQLLVTGNDSTDVYLEYDALGCYIIIGELAELADKKESN